MACNWHDYDERPQFCSLQKLKSWAYVISQHCCEDFKIDLLSGRHKPVERAGQTQVKYISLIHIIILQHYRFVLSKILYSPNIFTGTKEKESAYQNDQYLSMASSRGER